jgi:hypothetical protein
VRDVSRLVCLFLFACRLAAQPPFHQPHVRSESPELRRVIADAVGRSPTFRALVEAIDATDVIVYVRSRVLMSSGLEGRTGFLGASAENRFLIVELACPRTGDVEIGTIAHELQHVVEIARAPWVVNTQTLRQYYQVIGIDVSGGTGGSMFETQAAAEVGNRVRREVSAPLVTSQTDRTAHGDKPARH